MRIASNASHDCTRYLRRRGNEFPHETNPLVVADAFNAALVKGIATYYPIELTAGQIEKPLIAQNLPGAEQKYSLGQDLIIHAYM